MIPPMGQRSLPNRANAEYVVSWSGFIGHDLNGRSASRMCVSPVSKKKNTVNGSITCLDLRHESLTSSIPAGDILGDERCIRMRRGTNALG